MKKLITLLAVCVTALSASGQQVQVQLTVQPITKKKSSGDGYYDSRDVQANRALKITIQNSSGQHINGLTLRWAVVKSKTDHFGHNSDSYQGRAFGAEQQIDLKPLQQLIIETEAVGASRYEYDYSNRKYGEVIDGHGAQILKDGKIITEQIIPPTLKKAFEKIRPIEGDKK